MRQESRRKRRVVDLGRCRDCERPNPDAGEWVRCPACRRKQAKAKRLRNPANRLCPWCRRPNPDAGVKARCPACRKANTERTLAVVAAQRAAGLCVQYGCRVPVERGGRCPEHREYGRLACLRHRLRKAGFGP